MAGYADFAAYVAEINDLLCTMNILTWDGRTQMPPGGAATRGEQLATLTRIAQERFTGAKMGDRIAAADLARDKVNLRRGRRARRRGRNDLRCGLRGGLHDAGRRQRLQRRRLNRFRFRLGERDLEQRRRAALILEEGGVHDDGER